MKESTKTAAFVGSAVAMLLAAVFTGYANQPQPVDDYQTIGQAFYPDFEQTNQAKSLVVTSIDPDSVKQQTFEIKQIDGLWQIPSHEGYPAEAAQRLAETSASLVGLTRDSLVGRRPSDHEKFGVVDPRDEGVVDIESVGQSITLRDANEDVLVDLIIGDAARGDAADAFVPQDQQAAYYYVRRSDESNVYRIPLNIELSTKFSDWIEPDLLQLDASDVVSIELDNYQIEERSSGMFGQVKELLKKQGDQISIKRKSSTDDWTLVEQNDQPAEVVQDAVAEILAVLDDMAIVDVKKKPTLNGKILLDADLNYSLTPAQAELMSIRTQQQLDALTPDQQAEFQSLQMGVMELQRDLESRGFSFGSTGQALELVSAGGEMQAGTADGLRYTLHVGKAPTKTTGEIKIAGTANEEAEATDSKGADEANKSGVENDDQDKDAQLGSETEGGDSSDADSSDANSGDAGSRYVLIRVAFDPTLLEDPGEKPAPPQPPTKPDGYTEAVADGGEIDNDQSDVNADGNLAQAADGDAKATDDDEESESAPKPANMQRNPAFVQYDQDLAAYEEAKVDFEVSLNQWQSATEKFEQQSEDGKQKADILNGRFEKWYYIVSADNLKTLQSGRSDLVQPEVSTAGDDGAIAAALKAAREQSEASMQDRPDVSFPKIDTQPATEPADATPSDEVEKPSVQPPVDSSKSDDKSDSVGLNTTDVNNGQSADQSDTFDSTSGPEQPNESPAPAENSATADPSAPAEPSAPTETEDSPPSSADTPSPVETSESKEPGETDSDQSVPLPATDGVSDAEPSQSDGSLAE